LENIKKIQRSWGHGAHTINRKGKKKNRSLVDGRVYTRPQKNFDKSKKNKKNQRSCGWRVQPRVSENAFVFLFFGFSFF